MIPEARALYRLAPREFVADRNRLAKELKAAGRRDDATAVATLRRPRLAEYALNLTAAAEPEVIDRFASAVKTATDAQQRAIEHGDGGGLRAATDDLRKATTEIVAAATRALEDSGDGGEPPRMEIVDILRAILTDESVGQLRAGVLGSSAADASPDALQGEPPPTRRGPPVRKTSAPIAKATSPAVPRTGRVEPSTTVADRRARAKLATASVAERRRIERDLRLAQAQAASAERDLQRADKALRDAQESMRGAEERAGAARRVVDDLDARLRSLDRPSMR